MSYCPACGNPVSPGADTRFCARCGKELPAGPAAVPPPPPAAPPTVHAAMPAPPGHAPAGYPPAPAAPSPAVQFLRRAFTGRWEAPAAVALVPALCFVALAVVIGVWSGAAVHDPVVGFGTRTRLALAVLLTGVGATLRFSTSFQDYSDSGSVGDSGSVFGDSGSSSDVMVTSHASVSVIALAMTLLWVGALVVALRRTRSRLVAAGGTEGAEAAVRVALVAAGAALVLGLVAQPSIEAADIGTGPALLTVWAFLISLATALLTLCAEDVRRRLAARPGLAAAVRALRTALLALLITVALAGFVVFVVVGVHADETSGWGVAFAALFLPNLGVSGLGLGWGAPFRVSESRASDSYHFSFGLGQLGHVWDGWASILAVGGGVVCALVIGVLAVKRSADRIEQFLVAGLFTGLFVLLVAFGGLSEDGLTGASIAGYGVGNAHTALGTSVPEALMFALLWSCGGVLVAPYVWRALGGTVPPPMTRAYAAAAGAEPAAGPLPYVPHQPGAHPQEPPAAPPQAGPEGPGGPDQATVHDLGIVQPPRLNKPPDHR